MVEDIIFPEYSLVYYTCSSKPNKLTIALKRRRMSDRYDQRNFALKYEWLKFEWLFPMLCHFIWETKRLSRGNGLNGIAGYRNDDQSGRQTMWTTDRNWRRMIHSRIQLNHLYVHTYVRLWCEGVRSVVATHGNDSTVWSSGGEERKSPSGGERTGLRGTRFCFQAETRTMRKNIFRTGENVSRFRILIHEPRRTDSNLGWSLRNASLSSSHRGFEDYGLPRNLYDSSFFFFFFFFTILSNFRVQRTFISSSFETMKKTMARQAFRGRLSVFKITVDSVVDEIFFNDF